MTSYATPKSNNVKAQNMNYSSQYISFLENGGSAAVLIVRDIVKAIPTQNKWIDILSTKGPQNMSGQWSFTEISVELFPRTIVPQYPEKASEADRKYITWNTATQDIALQRSHGISGEKYRIELRLVNLNRNKTVVRRRVWNKTFARYVPSK